MQEAFREEGIEFAHRNVTVFTPSENDETESGEEKDEGAAAIGKSLKKVPGKTAAAAAIAAVQADEDAKTKK
jgi:hypothetical protein